MAGSPTIRTGLNVFQPLAFAKGRAGDLYFVNGVDRGGRWDGLTAASELLGITAPTVAPSATTPAAASSVTAGDYLLAYRWSDDTLPDYIPSSISPTVTVTAAAGDKFSWLFTAGTEARVKWLEIWRSTVDEADTLYFVARFGNNGTITGVSVSAGVSYTVTSAAHGLVAGCLVNITGLTGGTGTLNADLNTTGLAIASVTTNTFTINNAGASGTYGSGGTWTISGYTADSTSDATLSASTNDALPVLKENGEVNARRFVPPPDWTPYIQQFQDRTWYFGAVKYTAGTVATTSGSTTITGTSTAWTSQMAGRYIYIVGHTSPLLISSASASSITAATAATASLSGVAYCILPDPAYKNSAFYSEENEPESVPLTNEIVIQENTGDDDEIVGGWAYGSRFYFLKERHIYTMSFVRQPNIDASINLLASRGACNNRCFVFMGGMAYAMDDKGPYRISGDGIDEEFGNPVQDYFNEYKTSSSLTNMTVSFAYKKWFHITVDYAESLVFFHFGHATDEDTWSAVRPTRAFVYNVQTNEWTLDRYTTEIGAGCNCPINGGMRRLTGGLNEFVYSDYGPLEMSIVFGRAACTGTFSASTVKDSANTPFVAGMKYAPIAIVDGTGKGQVSRIASVDSSSQVTVSPVWSTAPDATSTYLIGAIEAVYQSGICEYGRGENYQKRALRLTYKPTTNANVLFARIYQNHSATAVSNKITDDVGLGVTTTAASPLIALDTKSARTAQGTQAGFSQHGFGGVTDDRGQGQRFVSVGLLAYQAAEQLTVYDLTLEGARAG